MSNSEFQDVLYKEKIVCKAYKYVRKNIYL